MPGIKYPPSDTLPGLAWHFVWYGVGQGDLEDEIAVVAKVARPARIALARVIDALHQTIELGPFGWVTPLRAADETLAELERKAHKHGPGPHAPPERHAQHGLYFIESFGALARAAGAVRRGEIPWEDLADFCRFYQLGRSRAWHLVGFPRISNLAGHGQNATALGEALRQKFIRLRRALERT